MKVAGFASSFLVLFALSVAAAAADDPPEHLLGRMDLGSLEAEPYSEWYREGFEEYDPSTEVLRKLRAYEPGRFAFEVYFGTWCGDSRREVPRLAKLFDAMDVEPESVQWVGVGREDELYKRSPDGEDSGLEIYRVPTIVVTRDGAEVSRIVEFPVRSLERDLLAVLSGGPYEPNYRSYPVVREWLREGLLSDENVSAWGLAASIRNLVAEEGELAAAAKVLFTRGDREEGLKLHEVNAALHRKSERAWARLAEARLEAEDREGARGAAERAVRLSEDPTRRAELLELLARIEGREDDS